MKFDGLVVEEKTGRPIKVRGVRSDGRAGGRDGNQGGGGMGRERYQGFHLQI